MKYRIHFEHQNGVEDFIDLEGDTVEEIRDKADKELLKRNAVMDSRWSERLA